MTRNAAARFALPISLALVCPIARGETDLHFDYTSFETGFGQAQFNVLNYPSINGNYMMTSTDNHRPEMVANGNQLAEFYNWLTDRYAEQTVKNGAAAADAINTYTVNNSTKNGPRPTWLILNEISSSLWSANPGSPSISTYRTWLIDCVTRLHEHFGYEVVTLAPFQNPGANNASWQALQEVSYVGIECYLSGTEVWNSGSTNAQRLAWATSQYQASKNSYMNRGVPADRLMVTEHFANNNATYIDNQGNTQTTGWGRAGLASAADWDQVIMLRQDAIKAVGFEGFLAYNWGGNAMGVTQAEQIQHEYYYRSRLVMDSQQPQWLSDNAINVNGTVIPLSWGQPLNWIGGVPNSAGAVANFYRTNTAARTVTLDGSKTAGVVTFNSPSSYTITPGTGGTLVLNSGISPATVSVAQGSHTIAANVQLQSNTTFAINAGTLTVSGAVSGSGELTKNGAGTLALTSGASNYSGITTINAGVVTVTADTCLGAVPVSPTSNAITFNGGTWRNVGTAAITIPTNRGITVLSGGGTLDFSSSAGVPALNAKITGAGTLTKMGIRTLNVGSDSSSSFFGNLIVRQGRLNVNTSGTVNPLGNGTITLGAGNGDVAQLGIGGAGGISSQLGNAIVLGPTGNGINSFEINGGNTLTLSGIVSGAGRLQKSGGSASGTQGGTPLVTTGSLVLEGNNTYTGGTVVNAGTLVAASGDALAGGALTVNSGATAQAQANLTKALRLSAITTVGTGKLDLVNNDLLVDYTGASVESQIRQLVKDGRTTGAGITTLAMPADDTVLAVADNTELGRSTWLGEPIDPTTIVGKYTYFGDANLDGMVTSDDYVAVDVGLGVGDSWVEGDFNMDGAVTSDDYVAIDVNLGKGTVTPLEWAELRGEMIALHTAMFGAEYVEKLAYAQDAGFGATLVPEPASAVLLFAAPMLAARRRRIRSLL